MLTRLPARSRLGIVPLLLAILLALLGVGLTPATAYGQAPQRPTATPEERAAALARPGVVFLRMNWSGYVITESGTVLNGGQPYQLGTRCTGFGVNPTGYVATAGHCVDPGIENGIGRSFLLQGVSEAISRQLYNTSDPEKLFAHAVTNWKIEGKTKGSPVDREVFVQRGIVSGGTSGGQSTPARVVDFRDLTQGDVALLKVEQSDLPSIELAPPGEIEIGTPILSIGYPGSTDQVTDATFEPTNKDGKVNAKKTVGSIPFYEISAANSGGMSGGPTVDHQGRVVGLVSFGPAAEAQAFNFIAPSSTLSEMLGRNGIKNELGNLDRTYREGLGMYFDGRYTDALGRFDQVLLLSPQHQQAQEYKQKAASNREKFGDVKAAGKEGGGGGVPMALIAALVVLLLGGVGLGLFLMTRRGKGGPSPAMVGGGMAPPGYIPSQSMPPMAPPAPATRTRATSRTSAAAAPAPRAASRTAGAGSRTAGAGSRTAGAGSRTTGTGARSAGAGSRTSAASSRATAPAPRTSATGSRAAGAGSRTSAASSRTSAASSRSAAAPASRGRAAAGGAKATPAKATGGFCSNCGSKRSATAKFCANCGSA